MRSAWKRKGVAIAAALASIATVAVIAAPSAQAKPPVLSISNEKAIYIVQMLDMPVVAYDGSIKGLAATKPAAGQKINPNSAKVAKYVEYLDGTHAAALARVGGRKVYDYRYALNGFAAELTEVAASKLAGLSGVVAVTKQEKLQLDTADTPDFLGLTAPGGLWEQLGGPTGGKQGGGAGEGVIVGIIDSGISPDSPSFSDRDAGGKLVYQQIPGWHGKCEPGEGFDGSDCNQKLIGARYYNAGFGGAAGVKADMPYEFISPLDYDGHGTHTASTAAGNAGVPVSVGGFDFGTVSGMAPRARVAAYKACWGTDTDGGCFSTDTVAAIDQAVADGVDVLNFSISGSLTSFLDPVEVAFLFAADAGVFVAASAGNEGPGASTVAHISPWLTTVAASTHPRTGEGSFTLGNGESYTGASLASAVAESPFVEAATVKFGDADADEARLCYPGTLDPSLTAGAIVLCDRGVIARTDKSLAVQMADGVGMIMVNTSPTTIHADAHWVPSVHVDADLHDILHAYAATPGATASIAAASIVAVPAPYMADFSSRGPALAGDGDVLKPDITAPGVDVLAAVSPYGNNGRTYDFLSGTSMSSPHVAGLGALMKDRHPGWSPAMIRSAFMTTAYGTLDGDAFGHGAGHVAPNSAADPGLVYDAGWNEWLAFLCGTGQLQASYCPAIAIDPSDLNQASIAIGGLAGVQTVTRTVTNVGPAATYAVTVAEPAGVDVVVSPETLDLGAGESAEYSVTFTSTPSATLDEFAQGSLTWTHADHVVRSPLVVRPVALAAPSEISATGDTSYDVTFGFSGPFTALPAGLVAATETPGEVVDDPANDINTALGTGVGITVHEIDIPAGSSMARFSLFDDFTSGNDDLDLYVFDSGFGFVGGSGSGTSAEQVDVVNPAHTTYFVIVHGWQTDGGAPATYTLFSWGLGGDEGNMVVTGAPAVGTIGETVSLGLEFSGLTAGSKYLGAVDYTLNGADAGRTIVRVDP